MTGPGWINPINGTVSSWFENRVNPVTGKPELHTGVDIAAPEDTPVAAACGGTVSETGQSALNGKYIRIATADGYETLYMHLNSVLAKEGQGVERGQIVALSGNTGRSSGPHLHYGVYKDGEAIDPSGFMSFTRTGEGYAVGY